MAYFMSIYHSNFLKLSLFALSLCQLSCSFSSEKTSLVATPNKDSVAMMSATNSLTTPDSIATIDSMQPSPIWGYRLAISGDFDGNGKTEQLLEHYWSQHTQKETNKFYEGLAEYEQLVDLTIQKAPYSFLLSNNTAIDTLLISDKEQQLGVFYLKNEGDLNDDGTDEVGYVVNWADWSSINTYYIVSFATGKWHTLYEFPIWDWQLPDPPNTSQQYGLFGLENTLVEPTNDTLMASEQNSPPFRGLVKKLGTNKIQVIYRNDEAEEDSMIVRLKKKR
ncbi:MAG TPA: hypothetical protein PKH93_00025 [Chitinophagales bacterium]|nr:hypothetical protein [Chitinophagales bacterium]